MNDYIGKYVKFFESGHNGSTTRGQSGHDWGLSCGSYQLTLRWGVCIEFLKKYFPKQADGLYFSGKDLDTAAYPGTDYASDPDSVWDIWMQCYHKAGASQFFFYEHEYIQSICYDPAIGLFQDILNLETTNRAYQEMIWSASVRIGYQPAANILLSLIQPNKFQIGEDPQKLFDLYYDAEYERMPVERYKKNLFNGNSERETLRKLLTQPPLKEGAMKKKIKVMLDAGHYGKYNQSCCNSAYFESDFTWKIHQLIGKYLTEYGMKVGYTREQQEADLGVVQRGQKAAGYDFLLSCHSNGTVQNVPSEVDYPVAYVMVKDDHTLIDNVSQRLGELLSEGVREVLQTVQPAQTYQWVADWDRNGNGKLGDDDYLGILWGAKTAGVPAAILEYSFHTNPQTVEKLLQEKYVDALAKKTAEIIAGYFGIIVGKKIKVEPMVGTLTVIYNGADGLNLHGSATYNGDVVGQLYSGEKRRVVDKITLSDNTTMYHLEDNTYVTTHGDYVKYEENPSFNQVGEVQSDDGFLILRDFPSSKEGRAILQLMNTNLFEILEEAYNYSDHWWFVHVKNEAVDIKGFLRSKYTKRV